MTEEKYQIAIYQTEDGGNEVTVHYDPQNVWLTETEVGEVFGTGRSNTNQHINNIFQEGELSEEGNVKKINNGFSKPTKVYSLDVIISVGYRVNAKKATHFRKWATEHLKKIVTDGYSISEGALMKSGKINELYESIRKIRLSEANQFQKVKDIFKASTYDYDKDSPEARHFFAMSQDKFHYAVTQKTAAEIVLDRIDSSKDKVGMVAFKDETPQISDVKTAKNYLDSEELRLLENISEQFLLFAESKAFRGQRMSMEELAHKLNTLLEANDYPVLYDYKKYYIPERDKKAKIELDKYRKRLRESKPTKQLPE